jgi:pyruvate kinase
MMTRATKIVATLGPASSDPDLLEQMIRAGVDVVRLNFSHGKAQDHIERARLVREAAQRAGDSLKRTKFCARRLAHRAG